LSILKRVYLTLRKLVEQIVHPREWLVARQHGKDRHLGSIVWHQLVGEVDKVRQPVWCLAIVSHQSISVVFDPVDRCIPSVLAEIEVRLLSDGGSTFERLAQKDILASSLVLWPVVHLAFFTALSSGFAAAALVWSRVVADHAVRGGHGLVAG
jgi:hypothetical protein